MKRILILELNGDGGKTSGDLGWIVKVSKGWMCLGDSGWFLASLVWYGRETRR